MVERQDIDALLISALYGELTPSEETRLAVHLDSHPGDRTALADLTHARTLVRESRLLQVQLEPPQSVSALLMKEATRCAPKPEVQEGWFARFVRSFAAHPAMAAAAMLVLILGVATLVTRRKGDQFAESTAPAQTVAQDQLAAENAAEPTGAAMGSAQSDSYRVALDEGASDGLADQKSNDKLKRDEVDAKPKLAKEQQEESGALATTTKKKSAGIELRAPQSAPKDFEDDTRAAKGGKAAESKNELAFGDNDDAKAPPPAEPAPKTATAPRAGGEATTGSSSGAVVGGSAPGAPNNRRYQDPAAAPTQPTTTATAPRPAPPPAPVVAKPEPRRDAPAKTVDRNATARAAGPAEEKAADPQLAWARDQHNALIAQVRAGECKKAASIATAISNRAPAYYQQNVETDRSVKACIAYINSERERDAEQRSERARANQKRSVNEPSPVKAAPSKPTATDTTK